MNAITEAQPIDQSQVGLYHKFNVTRTDGSSAPGGKHHRDEYFVLELSDKHSIPALAAYAESCAGQYPQLAADLRAKVSATVAAANEFVPVPETTLPDGTVVPAFQVARYLSSKGPADIPMSTAAGAPWIGINYHEARGACEANGFKLLTETQALAIAWLISQQDINWTGGKVGEGKVFQGLHKGTAPCAQPGDCHLEDPEQRRWHELPNGERVFDFAGNAYTWIFDNVQGDEQGLVKKKFSKKSPSISTAPYPSREKGMGWQPSASADWSGRALVRGGYWYDGDYAGVFTLHLGWPDNRYDNVGFRCTK